MKPNYIIELANTYGLYAKFRWDNESVRIYIPKKKSTHRWIDWNFLNGSMVLFRDGFRDIMGNKLDAEDVILLAKSIKK